MALGSLLVESSEDRSGVEMVCPRKDSDRFGWPGSDLR